MTRPRKWDIFISHATEDKDEVARPLAESLKDEGLDVWYDEFTLKLGMSLRQTIDRGLARSRFGVVILSPNFFKKHWPANELNGLATRESKRRQLILPVWHNVGFQEVRKYSPMLADRVSVSTANGLYHVVTKILEVLREGRRGVFPTKTPKFLFVVHRQDNLLQKNVVMEIPEYLKGTAVEKYTIPTQKVLLAFLDQKVVGQKFRDEPEIQKVLDTWPSFAAEQGLTFLDKVFRTWWISGNRIESWKEGPGGPFLLATIKRKY